MSRGGDMISEDPHNNPKNTDIKCVKSTRAEGNTYEGKDKLWVFKRDGSYYKQKQFIREYGGTYTPASGEKEIVWAGQQMISKQEYDQLLA